jgi:hypothetical protein
MGTGNRVPWRRAACVATIAAALVPVAAAVEGWQIAGQQGLVRFVIVPVEQATDRQAYEREIVSLCEPERTCFLNFYTNASGAPLAMPLPDAIAHEATATYRRSMKNGVQLFRWSCRMQVPDESCF